MYLIHHNTCTMPAKPFVKWVGGKGQLLPTLKKSLPEKILAAPALTYVEPFVGGGAMLFHLLPALKNIRRAVINDINPDLMQTYVTVRNHLSGLLDALKNLQNEYHALQAETSRKEFYLRQRERFNEKNLPPIENSALFIFLNRTCFNGLYRVNSKGAFNVPFGKYTKPTICDAATLYADSELLRGVEILTGDFSQTLRHAAPDTLFYLDPPYKPLSRTSSFNSYAKEEFDDSEQIRLKKFCDSLTEQGAMWMLSNSDVKSNDPENNFFDALYAPYHIERVWASRMVNANPEKRGKLTELLITNT